MAKYNLYKSGSVDDVKSSFRFIKNKITVKELQAEIDEEMKHHGRASLINMYNAAINKKLKHKTK